jgi:Bifunctional DNA primase/polymerase, N-terminal
MMNYNHVLAQALDLGLPVFPCRLVGKDKVPTRPKSQGGNGFHDATDNPTEIRKLWSWWPGELIGVPTGEASGFDVLDVDPRNGGRDWYDANRAKLPETRVHRTLSGGLHLFFLHHEGVRNSNGRIAPGIDVRGPGGYVIWWPATGREFTDYPATGVPEWPGFILSDILPKKLPAPRPLPRPIVTGADWDREKNALIGLVKFVAESPQGERNARLHWAACRAVEKIRAGIASETGISELLIEAAVYTGLPRGEAITTIGSALRGARHG